MAGSAQYQAQKSCCTACLWLETAGKMESNDHNYLSVTAFSFFPILSDY